MTLHTLPLRRALQALVILLTPLAGFAAAVKFEIPSQPAHTALRLFVKQSGTEVLFVQDDLERVKSNAVVGEFEPADAIGRLLKGTGYAAKKNESGKFVVAAERHAAAPGRVTGSLVTAIRGEPIVGATVRVAGEDIACVTGSAGGFVLSDVPAGTHLLHISSDTIVPAKITNVRVRAGETTNLDALEIPMPGANGSLEMKEVTVNASDLEKGLLRMQAFEVSDTKVTGIINQGIIPRQENEAVRYNIISRDDIDRSGVTTLPELMRRVSANQETGTTSQRTFSLSAAGTGNFLGQGDLVNLRGMGNGQTLVMINGRRLYGSDTSGADVSRIPLAAVERIEILPSSGSAIYGANSGAGVINVIMKTGYKGTELTTYAGASTHKGAEEIRADLFTGMTFNEGRTSLNIGLGFGRRNELTRGERDYDQRAIDNKAAAVGTTYFRSIILPMAFTRRPTIITTSPLGLGIPSNPTAVMAVVPAGTSGLGLTPDSFNATANTAEVNTDRLARTRLLNQSTNEYAMLNLDHKLLGDALGFYSELTWRQEVDPVRFPSANSLISLTATDPRNPFRTGVTPGFVGRAIVIYRDPADLPDDLQIGTRTTLRAVAGLYGKWKTVSGRQYSWSADASWDRNTSDSESHNQIGGITPASQAGYYSVLKDLTGAPLLPESEWRKYGYHYRSVSKPTVTNVNLRLNGDLIQLWGGPARFSLVGEARREDYVSETSYSDVGEYIFLPGGFGSSLIDRISSTRRKFFAGGGELELPIVGERNRKAWLYSLDISGGARYEKNQGFFAATPPLAALKIAFIRDAAFRIAYQEGFQPPSLFSLTNPATITPNVSSAGYVDALRPGVTNPNYTSISSGNPDLKPETSKTWDVGVILTPRWLPGLSVNAAYFRYDKKDVVSGINLTTAITSFPELVVRDPASPADVAAGRPGPVNTFYNKSVNFARQFSDGVDLNVRYDLPPTPIGRFTFTTDATWTKRFFSQARPDAPKVNAMGVAPLSSNFVLERRGSAGLIWSRDAWSASAIANYTGSFESSTTAPSVLNPNGSGIDGLRIASAITVDLQVSYAFRYNQSDARRWRKYLGGTKWSIGALNAFDKEPALWTDRIRGFYSTFVDPRQQFVYLQVKKTL